MNVEKLRTDDILAYLRQMIALRASANMSRPEGYAYGSIEEFVFKHGQQYGKGGLTKSERQYVLAAAKRQGSFPIKQCFYNSQMVLLNCDPKHKFTYVEGYATGLIPVQHGWLTINGKVIDFTMREWSKETGAIEVHGLGALLDDWAGGFPLLKTPFVRAS